MRIHLILFILCVNASLFAQSADKKFSRWGVDFDIMGGLRAFGMNQKIYYPKYRLGLGALVTYAVLPEWKIASGVRYVQQGLDKTFVLEGMRWYNYPKNIYSLAIPVQIQWQPQAIPLRVDAGVEYLANGVLENWYWALGAGYRIPKTRFSVGARAYAGMFKKINNPVGLVDKTNLWRNLAAEICLKISL
jgi:hypothetical protein